MARDTFTIDGKAIRRARVFAGYGGRELAKQVGITGAFLSQLENGHRGASPAVLKRLADATGKKVEDFVSFDAAQAA